VKHPKSEKSLTKKANQTKMKKRRRKFVLKGMETDLERMDRPPPEIWSSKQLGPPLY
jgi:hypothetical protein